MAGKMPSIGESGGSTSYPTPNPGKIGTANTSLGQTGHNFNVANFVEDPEVFNASPATKKNYSWNKGETGNAN
jgi:mannose-1-phosphate guanylyltransferase